ncbi:hypothetical protein BDV26DRAFT_253024, partial [Aspergillus bertholletiae]
LIRLCIPWIVQYLGDPAALVSLFLILISYLLPPSCHLTSLEVVQLRCSCQSRYAVQIGPWTDRLNSPIGMSPCRLGGIDKPSVSGARLSFAT